MRWIRFSTNDTVQFGLLNDDDHVSPVRGDPFNGYEKTGQRLAFADVVLEVPVIPTTFYAAGMNYADHVLAMSRRTGVEAKLPTAADIGYRGNNALLAHGRDILVPADAGPRVQYEAELVVVIGKKAKGIEESEVPGVILGYTIGNDVSERDWQKSDRTFWRCKNTDTFKPMGPWIETQFDPSGAKTSIRLNGALQHEFDTEAMIFGVSHFISRMSRYLTLWPGDVIWMGTDGTSPDLQHGDVVDISISGLGSLRNRIIRVGHDRKALESPDKQEPR
ncbi:fumarylacetoacetate hydrolase family protein [Ottowia thiooxydans]|uniref:fumarylacetoacetate hydrolase family protein n=1 Tax=Ottowia thiooxydans TaxID=219182 RepID=UPI0004113805|nr:fumarylacetoacetate hydrolase family protein [Ottowia thiooxydans]